VRFNYNLLEYTCTGNVSYYDVFTIAVIFVLIELYLGPKHKPTQAWKLFKFIVSI